MKTKQNIVVLVAFQLASLCYAQHTKLSSDLEGRDPEGLVNVIVQYKQVPEQRHIDAVIRRGGRHLGTLGAVKAAVYSVAGKALADLANDPDVKYISPDRPLKAASSQLQSDFKLQATGANVAQVNGFNGAGIGVAIQIGRASCRERV